MSGGGKLEKINTRERAVSQDINRLQAFQAYDRAEVLRRLMDNRTIPEGGGYLEGGSFVNTTTQDAAAVGTPLRGDVIEGLVGLPQVGTLSMFVSPGIVGLDDPDGQTGSSDATAPNPDDSRYKLVVDPGVQIGGVLVIGAGAGSTRVDVIECKRQTVIVETDNRDIFDSATGLFTAVAVTKVTEGRLTYRVRVGTPGAGLPANVQGWLPICVAVVPSSATTVDDMTFWDVRPLVKDRINAPSENQSLIAQFDQTQRVFANSITDVTKCTVSGVSTSQIGMYRAGGDLKAAGTSDIIDVRDAVNQNPAYTPIPTHIWFLYAVFPGGLPRWVRYGDFPAARVPAGPLGVLTVHSVGPASTSGLALLNTVLVPTACGIGVTGLAVLLCAGRLDGSSFPAGFLMHAGMAILTDLTAPISPTSSGAQTDRYDLDANISYPKNAKSVLMQFFCTLSAASGTDSYVIPQVEVLSPTTSTALVTMQLAYQHHKVPSLGALLVSVTVEVPCVPVGTANGMANNDLQVNIIWGSSLTKSDGGAFILGWRL